MPTKEVKFVRDEKGRVIKIENPDAIPEIMDNVVLIPFVDAIRNSVQEFDKNTTKYSKRMERLTIAIVGLTVAQLVTSAILIYIAIVGL